MDTSFKRSGTGPVQKTYSYDPTRQATAQKLVRQGFKETKKSTWLMLSGNKR